MYIVHNNPASLAARPIDTHVVMAIAMSILMRLTHTALRLRDMDTVSRRQS